jgi:hypothetical protein
MDIFTGIVAIVALFIVLPKTILDLFNNPRNGIVKHGKGKRGREKRFI